MGTNNLLIKYRVTIKLFQNKFIDKNKVSEHTKILGKLTKKCVKLNKKSEHVWVRRVYERSASAKVEKVCVRDCVLGRQHTAEEKIWKIFEWKPPKLAAVLFLQQQEEYLVWFVLNKSFSFSPVFFGATKNYFLEFLSTNIRLF